MAEMQMNYQEMRATAEGARNLAEQVRTAIKTLQDGVARLLPTWQGASQAAFEAAYAPCCKILERAPKVLDEIALALALAAEKIELAEQQAAAAIPTTVTSDNVGAGGGPASPGVQRV